MPITWRNDIDNVLKDAKTWNKPALLDFTAAPM
jgi:hypothetical protein